MSKADLSEAKFEVKTLGSNYFNPEAKGDIKIEELAAEGVSTLGNWVGGGGGLWSC